MNIDEVDNRQPFCLLLHSRFSSSSRSTSGDAMRALITLLCLALGSCASVGSLPQSASEANLGTQVVGKTGWSEYQDVMFVRGIDRDTAFLAAKEGLASASFTVKKGNATDGMVVGSRGMTAYDWNVVAGVYFAPERGGYVFKVIAEGSKDTGLWGDHTASSWPQDIFRGIRRYIAEEASISNPDQGVFQMRPNAP
jgi:hypothetical protein